MTSSSENLADVLDDLSQWLQQQKEDGLSTLPVQAKPAQNLDELKKATSASTSKTAAPSNSERELVLLHLQRMDACSDGQGQRIAVLTAPGELDGEPGTLLANMLKAIGFEPSGDPVSCKDLADGKQQFPVLIAMGDQAVDRVSPVPDGLKLFRGKFLDTPAGRCMVTFSPSYLETTPSAKKAAWQDLQLVLKELGLTVPDWTASRLKKK